MFWVVVLYWLDSEDWIVVFGIDLGEIWNYVMGIGEIWICGKCRLNGLVYEVWFVVFLELFVCVWFEDYVVYCVDCG